MFVRNTDTGKWFNQTDTLSKDVYDNLKQDFEKTRLYSKCLSGATFLPIDGFENIYNTFDLKKIGYYVNDTYTYYNIPQWGDQLVLNRNNSNDFYNKYLKENAFTIKNLFTPNKLIKDQLDNHLLVDVATDAEIIDIGQTNANYVIDGITLLEGHRVLVKNQKSEITLSNSVDPEVYFSTTELVSEYFLDVDNVTSKNYFWFNQQNGIYKYTNKKLVRTEDLSTYEDAYKYSVVVKLGETNREKQFHLARLKNGYYPLSSENQNLQFVEKTNWVLRNRVDYNNIYDLNFYDIIQHSTQSVFVESEGRTYSIPSRTVIVGEFGAIINNQDIIQSSATHSISNIISNKFKVNLRSIVEVENYYWCCGDEGTLLKISKHDYNVERIDLDETSNLNSISFFGNLYGKIVGDYNTIWWTNDGGLKWNKLVIPEFDIYSYNKVVYYDFAKTYVAGDIGVFIEFNYSNGSWFSYKRKIAKQLNALDEYILVEDINDLYKTDWVKIVPRNYKYNNNSVEFGQGTDFINTELNDFYGLTQSYLSIELSSQYLTNSVFLSSQFYIAFSIEDSDGNIIYTNSNYNVPFVLPSYPSFQSYDLYLFNGGIVPTGTTTFKKRVDIPLLPLQVNGNLKNTTFTVNFEFYYNYDSRSNSVGLNFDFISSSYKVQTKKGDLLLMAANNNTVICYDIDSLITNSTNQFIYFTSTQSFSDVRTITRKNFNEEIYISGESIYNFSLGVFLNSGTISNASFGTSSLYSDKFINRILFRESDDKPYIVGNNSLSQFLGTSSFIDLDPTFNSKIKSKLLFLDYDVASKLNFFTDDGNYRLPNSVTFSQSSFTQSFILSNITGEKNWLNYYKDAEKTFKFSSSISDTDKVEFSTTFSYYQDNSSYTLGTSNISTNLVDILPLAPGINSPTFSRFIQHSSIAQQYSSPYSLFINKYLLIFRITVTRADLIKNAHPRVGDVLRIESNVIDCNLVINRIESYTYNVLSAPGQLPNKSAVYPPSISTNQAADIYAYCYSNFNETIIRNLKISTTPIKITNLNKYSSASILSQRFELHPVSIAYSMATSSNIVTVTPRFNNKTAYYNLQSQVSLGTQSKQMKYEDSFLNFGYSPTYNILDYLQRIDVDRFTSNYKFTIMPEFYSLPGNNLNSSTSSNVWVDLTVGASGSYYRSGTNLLIFGSDFKFHWDALLLHTFVDLTIISNSASPYTTEKLLIIKKYYDAITNGYVMEFHKKIETPTSPNPYPVSLFNIVSRNTLELVSEDLQTLNNIQRSSIIKSVQYLQTFTNLESELISKFPTDSYFKILASDYNIREFVSAVIYTDTDYQMAMNVLNVDKNRQYKIVGTSKININGFIDKLVVIIQGRHELKVGDLIDISFYGGTFSSEILNPTYHGLHTVISSISTPVVNYIVTSVDFNVPSQVTIDIGTISFIKKDPFFNYIPVDLFNLGSDKKVSKAIEVRPENYVLNLDKYNLENLDLNRFRYSLVDGLSLEELTNRFSWILEAEIGNAVIGRDSNGGLIWYSGDWFCGRWFNGTWYSGRWVSGDWYGGNWNSFNTNYQIISVIVDNSFVDNTASKWYNGRWFDGTWSGGTWYNGRRYAGEWQDGLWYEGIWNDGRWMNGRFEGGVWVLGTWENGVFNCDSKPAYWLDGLFKSGDFENGIWYNGQFGNDKQRLARFGTKSTNSRTSLWHAGKWIDGEFHSFLNTNSDTGVPEISEIHKYSIWRTGLWLRGNFYGGIAYNIDFKSGNWHGGILEEIQVIGVDKILPATASTNSITVNGIFKFNPGDEIWIIDDYRAGAFSPLGNNDNPLKYRINKILEDSITEQTQLYLNFNLSSLGVNSQIATQSYSNVETGLRVVSHFQDSYWKSGIWTNGIFDGGQFDSGIWYNGVFDGNWGN